MKTYICQICGDAYLGAERPKNCPFCGAREMFIKEGKEARPVVYENFELSPLSRKNLEETLALELRANALYLCMAGKTKTYEIKALYKRLAKIELEHAVICTKLLKIEMPTTKTEICSDEDRENFQKTVELEDHASGLYARFAKEAEETPVRIMFTALNQAELDHIELIKNYL